MHLYGGSRKEKLFPVETFTTRNHHVTGNRSRIPHARLDSIKVHHSTRKTCLLLCLISHRHSLLPAKIDSVFCLAQLPPQLDWYLLDWITESARKQEQSSATPFRLEKHAALVPASPVAAGGVTHWQDYPHSFCIGRTFCWHLIRLSIKT